MIWGSGTGGEAAAGRGKRHVGYCVRAACCVFAKKKGVRQPARVAVGAAGPRSVLFYQRAIFLGGGVGILACCRVFMACCFGSARSFAPFVGGGWMEAEGGRPLLPSLGRGDACFKRCPWRYGEFVFFTPGVHLCRFWGVNPRGWSAPPHLPTHREDSTVTRTASVVNGRMKPPLRIHVLIFVLFLFCLIAAAAARRGGPGNGAEHDPQR